MSKYTSFHFSPLNNRSMLMPRVPKGTKPEPRRHSNVRYEKVDPSLITDPYAQFNTGLTKKTIEVNGVLRSYGIYVPQDMRSKGACALIVPDNGITAETFLETENWKELSEKNKLAYIIFEADRWDKDDVEKEFDFIQQTVYMEFGQRLTVDICESYIYPIGLGDGAYVAAALALTYSATYPAFAADGDCGVDPELFEVLRSLPSDGIDTWKKPEIAMPGFIIDRSGRAEATKQYMKETIRAKEEGLRNEYGEVYLEQPRIGAYFVNEQPISQVWLADGKSMEGKSRNDLNEAMVSFVLRFSRWGGFGNNHLRAKRSPSETGVKRVEQVIDGLPRYWDVYVPSCYRADEEKEYPLVVAIHGMSCNSEYFAMTSDWHRLAEERGFFVVFASAYPRNDGLARFPVPHWSLGNTSLGDDLTDRELLYYEEMLNTMERDYRIDTKRIYAVGHSNGSQMTQALSRHMPERFAAFGPTGALGGWDPKDLRRVPDKVGIPIYFMMAEFDIMPTDFSEGAIARETIENYCRANHMTGKYDNWYVNGNYHTLVIYNDNHVPMIRYTLIKGSPHTYTAEMAQLTWDTFLCHFSREKDGTVVYKG
ncbi:MAG: PHB depolymerase family esterase [Erysipelotrichaceae bacterium]|nr:PHB depolymerase family esterase [Erysipelotrichaceae bacterium]